MTADRVEELRTRRVAAAMARERATSVDAASAALEERGRASEPGSRRPWRGASRGWRMRPEAGTAPVGRPGGRTGRGRGRARSHAAGSSPTRRLSPWRSVGSSTRRSSRSSHSSILGRWIVQASDPRPDAALVALFSRRRSTMASPGACGPSGMTTWSEPIRFATRSPSWGGTSATSSRGRGGGRAGPRRIVHAWPRAVPGRAPVFLGCTAVGFLAGLVLGMPLTGSTIGAIVGAAGTAAAWASGRDRGRISSGRWRG